jgi:hypothetical protein
VINSGNGGAGTSPRAHLGPPQSTGHYCLEGDRWWDDNEQRWYPASAGHDSLEITVEEIGQRSLLRALFSTLSGSYGSAYLWFIGEATSVDSRWPSYRIVGDSFPIMRAQPFDDLACQGPFAEEANHALTMLRKRLTDEGWKPNGHGKHWYSYQYSRPRLDWDDPADTESSARTAV